MVKLLWKSERKKPIQLKDITFQCQANGLKNTSACFPFSKAFIIIPHKRSDIRKPLIVMPIQQQISSVTDFAGTLRRTGWSNSGLLHGRNDNCNISLGKIQNLYFMGPPP